MKVVTVALWYMLVLTTMVVEMRKRFAFFQPKIDIFTDPKIS